METQLKFVRLLSLQEMALRRVVVLLWSSSDVLAFHLDFPIPLFYTDEISKKWRETIEDKIRGKVSKLELPKSLLSEMTDIVRPVGLQIKRWMETHNDFISAANKDSSKLCWTTAGTINYLKTAELLHSVVEDRDSTCEKPCTSTCDDSLENYIAPVWKKLSSMGITIHRENRPPGMTALMLSKALKFVYSLQERDKTAAEFFFQKLSRKDREVILPIIVHNDTLSLKEVSPLDNMPYDLDRGTAEVLCYLLSVITPELQMEMVKSRPMDVVMCFFHWPWQDLFLLNADLVWTFIPPSRYEDLFWKVIGHFGEDYYFPKSFQEFFVRSPPDFKKYFVESEVEAIFPMKRTQASLFLYFFFENEDSECVEVIFRNVDAASRVKLVFRREVFRLFYISISEDRWHMVEVCLREAALGDEDRRKLRRDFKRFLRKELKIRWWKPRWKRFFDFLDGANTSANKDNKKKPKLGNRCPQKLHNKRKF